SSTDGLDVDEEAAPHRYTAMALLHAPCGTLFWGRREPNDRSTTVQMLYLNAWPPAIRRELKAKAAAHRAAPSRRVLDGQTGYVVVSVSKTSTPGDGFGDGRCGLIGSAFAKGT